MRARNTKKKKFHLRKKFHFTKLRKYIFVFRVSIFYLSLQNILLNYQKFQKMWFMQSRLLKNRTVTNFELETENNYLVMLVRERIVSINSKFDLIRFKWGLKVATYKRSFVEEKTETNKASFKGWAITVTVTATTRFTVLLPRILKCSVGFKHGCSS